jgi:hypothetical protein
MKTLSTVFVAIGLADMASAAFAAGTVNNDAWMTTTSGAPIYAQGGSISKFGSTYYWYSVQYGGAASYYSSGTANSDTSFVSINVYTSIDLINWTAHTGVVATSTSGFSGTSWVGHVVNVLYNSSSGLYVTSWSSCPVSVSRRATFFAEIIAC